MRSAITPAERTSVRLLPGAERRLLLGEPDLAFGEKLILLGQALVLGLQLGIAGERRQPDAFVRPREIGLGSGEGVGHRVSGLDARQMTPIREAVRTRVNSPTLKLTSVLFKPQAG